MSSYIDLLVKRDKAKREKAARPTDMANLIDWHIRCISECLSAINGMQGKENAKCIKYQERKRMHEMTVKVLNRLKEHDSPR